MEYPVEYEIAYQKIVKDLWELKKEHGSYRKLANYLGTGIPPSYLHQIMKKGYRPQGGKHARALGIPEVKLMPVIICSECNQEQIRDICGCTEIEYPKEIKPRRKDYRKRIRVELDPDLSPEWLKLIRGMTISQRTNRLKGTFRIRLNATIDRTDQNKGIKHRLPVVHGTPNNKI